PAPDLVARSTTRGSNAVAWESAVGDVWKMYLKPRPVIRSEYDSVSHGSSARSVTSVTASVKLDSQQPMPPTTSGSCAIRRCAAFLAFSAESPASIATSSSFAPPIDLIPPAALTSPTAVSAPHFTSVPCRAHGPLNGQMTAIFTGFGCACSIRHGIVDA